MEREEKNVTRSRRLKWILLGGWALFFLNAFLALIFPNAAWNRAASWTLWLFSIALFVFTIGVCVVVTIRLTFKVVRRITRSHVGERSQVLAISKGVRPTRLGPALLIALTICVFVAGLLVFIEHQIKASPVYQDSVAKAQTSSEVVRILGQPIHEDWLCLGEISQSSNGKGHAKLKIPLSGPNGRGTLEVVAIRLEGKWRFSALQFSAAGHSPAVDLCCER